MSVQDTLTTLLSQLKNTAKTETVFGEPIVAGSATVIPVTRISFGFSAAGSAKKDGVNGSGGGVRIEPVALISITADGKVKVYPVNGRSAVEEIVAHVIDVAPEQVIRRVKKAFEKGTEENDRQE
ncbi:MAG: GerW family sporulation protein [Fibrobacterota bacterium]